MNILMNSHNPASTVRSEDGMSGLPSSAGYGRAKCLDRDGTRKGKKLVNMSKSP